MFKLITLFSRILSQTQLLAIIGLCAKIFCPKNSPTNLFTFCADDVVSPMFTLFQHGCSKIGDIARSLHLNVRTMMRLNVIKGYEDLISTQNKEIIQSINLGPKKN